MQPLVRVSDLSLYLRCPRLVYFASTGALQPLAPDPAKTLLRHLMLSIDTAIADAGIQLDAVASGSASRDEIEAVLSCSLERIASEMPLFCEDIDSAKISVATDGVKAVLSQIARMPLEMLQPCETDLDMRSDRLRLSGRLDRLVKRHAPRSRSAAEPALRVDAPGQRRAPLPEGAAAP